MSEYRLTRDAGDDLLKMFLYGFETFGLTQAEAYREGMIQCFELNHRQIRNAMFDLLIAAL